MHILLCLVFGSFALGILCHAIVGLINHFSCSRLPHPLVTMLTVFVGSLAAYGVIGFWAVNDAEKDAAILPFFSMMLSSGTLWLFFRLSAWLGSARRWGFTGQRLLFLLSAMLPVGAALAANAANILPAVK